MTAAERHAREIGVGVIGFGWMGEVHARAHTRLPQHYPDEPLRPRLAAVAELDPGRRERAVDVFGFPRATADWREVVAADDVAVVSVCGPNFTHREVAVAAAEAGKHLWVEKPAGRDLDDVLAIAAAARAAGVRAAVGFNYRNAPAVEAARELVAAGELGDIESVAVSFLSDYAAHPDGALSWRFDPALAGTGVLGDLASHALDLAVHIAGSRTGPITEVVADLATHIAERPEPVGAVSHFATAAGGDRGPVGNEDHVGALLRFASGARGSCEASRVAVGEQCSYRVEVRGTRGALAWDFRRLGELRVAVGGYQDTPWQTRHAAPGSGEYAAFQPGSGVAMGYDDLKVIEARRLLASIATGAPEGATIDDMVAVARVMAAVARSGAEARWVRVEEVTP